MSGRTPAHTTSERDNLMSLTALQDLSGRTALVTGGSRGLGLQMAEVLGELGARVAITARKSHELEAASAHLRALGVEVLPLVGDMAELAAIPASFRAAAMIRPDCGPSTFGR